MSDSEYLKTLKQMNLTKNSFTDILSKFEKQKYDNKKTVHRSTKDCRSI